MGLFSSRKKILVDTTVMRVVEDDQIPDAHLKTLIQALFKNQGISETFVDYALNGQFRNFERMYRYARDGDYFYNLPNTRLISNTDGQDIVEGILATLEGTPVTLDYAYFMPANHFHLGWEYITDNLGYNDDTNELETLSASKGFPVYLDDIVAVYQLDTDALPETGSRELWGKSPRSGRTPERPGQDQVSVGSLVAERSWREGPSETDSVEIKYIWADPGEIDEEGEVVREPATYEETLTVDLSSYGDLKDYYQARYRFTVGGVEQVKYWTYDLDDGTYPALANVFELAYSNPGTYFPFVMFRHNGANRVAEEYHGAAEYETTTKLLDYIGMDFQELGDQIHENPDAEDIMQACLMMAIPLDSDRPLDIEYLFMFFNRLLENMPQAEGPETNLLDFNVKGFAGKQMYALEFKDADFIFTLGFEGVSKRLRAGNIGPKGTYSSEELTAPVNNSGSLLGQLASQVVVTGSWSLKYQVTETVYEEIILEAPATRYEIYQHPERPEGVLARADDGRVLIPLDYELVKDMPFMDRETLYYRSLHFVFNSMVIQKTKWYQTGAFKALLTIAAVVITLWTGADFISLVLNTIQAGSYGVAAMALVQVYLASMVVDYTFSLLAKELGSDIALILAVATLAYGAYRGFKAGGLGKDMWAENLLKIASNLTQGIQTDLQRKFAQLRSDAEDFQLMAEQKWEELEELKALLDTKNLLDPMTFIRQQPLFIAGESSDSYFTRTVHSGNVGAKAFDILENFYDISLTLPTANDTLGEYV